MSAFIKYKGIGDIVVASILTFKPEIIYGSPVTEFLARQTGLHLSNAASAPGFNQAIACMVAAVGVGHIVAARSSNPDVHYPIFAMNLSWAVGCLLTCLTPSSWQLGSATQLMSALNHFFFSAVMWQNLRQSKRVGASKREM